MPLLGMLAAGAIKGGAMGKLQAEETKNSIFREMVGQEIAHKYDMRRMEAQQSRQMGNAYYKNQLNMERDAARSEQRAQELKAKAEEQRTSQESKHGFTLKEIEARNSGAAARSAEATSRTAMTQAGADRRKAQDIEMKQRQLDIQQQLADTKGELAEVTKAKSGLPIDKSKQIKNNSGIDFSMF